MGEGERSAEKVRGTATVQSSSGGHGESVH